MQPYGTVSSERDDSEPRCGFQSVPQQVGTQLRGHDTPELAGEFSIKTLGVSLLFKVLVVLPAFFCCLVSFCLCCLFLSGFVCCRFFVLLMF